MRLFARPVGQPTGKKQLIEINSGVKHNKEPSTPRGFRRRERKQGNKTKKD